MATITIRNLDDSLKARLRVRAATHDRSMEEEARVILRKALEEDNERSGIGTLIHRRFMEDGGADLPPPRRDEPARSPDNLR